MELEELKTYKKIGLIKDENLRTNCIELLSHLVKEHGFASKPAAKFHHHAYPGGLDNHTSEVIDFALELNQIAGRPFTDDSVTLVSFLHDLEKVYIYQMDRLGAIQAVNTPCSGEALVLRLCIQFGIDLSVNEVSAIEFAHGGWSTQAHNRFVQPSKLSSLLHCADLLSANFGSTSKMVESLKPPQLS